MATRNISLPLLEAAPSSFQGDEVVAARASCPDIRKTIREDAGYRYFALLHKQIHGSSFRDVRDGDSEMEEEEEVDVTVDKEKMEAKKRRMKKKKAEDCDYYELLGLGHLRYKATQKDIKDAYRKAVLVHHPDKQKASGSGSGDAADDEHFKLIQKANDVLSNQRSRRAYDSEDPFEDSIPSESDVANAKDFFALFSPVFERNGKWSTSRKVPSLGDTNSKIDNVLEFYDFWRRFDSWRDFSSEHEYDVEDAESRDEKRWMERQNKKASEGKKKEERARINTLTDLAYKYDPRIIKMNEQIEEDKKREKLEKAAIREREREAKEKFEEQERLKKEAEEKQKEEELARLRKEKDAQKKSQKKRRTKLRQLTRDVKKGDGSSLYNVTDVELVCLNCDAEALLALNNAILPDPKSQVAVDAFQQQLKAVQDKLGAKKDTSASQSTGAEWTDEDLSLLAKALRQLPAGTQRRWEKVAEFMGGKWTKKQIISKAKNVNQGDKPPELQKSAKDEAKTEYEKWMRSKKSAKGEITEEMSKRVDTGMEIPDEAKWTQEEQDQLEKALNAIPLGTPMRWEQVHDHVEGRTMEQCVKRYQFLVRHFKAQRMLGKMN